MDTTSSYFAMCEVLLLKSHATMNQANAACVIGKEP